MAKHGRGVQKAAKALATANGVAHVAFFGTFVWRIVTSFGAGRYASMVLAALALVGLGLGIVGWMLVKHGGRTAARSIGLWAIAGSSALAAVLLVAA